MNKQSDVLNNNMPVGVSTNTSSTRFTYLLVLLAVIIISLSSSLNLVAQRANYTDGAARAGNLPPNTGKQLRTDNIARNNSGTGARLADFTVAAGNGQYELGWETIVENNVKQYEVEFSYDNKVYQRAGVVVAANKTVYAFNHITAAKPAIFYRLRITDVNGSISFSDPVSIGNLNARPADQVSPTIVRDGMLNITLTNSYRNLQVFNNAGVEVFRDNIGGRTGNRIGFDLPALPAGPYYVKLVGDGISTTKKFMIM